MNVPAHRQDPRPVRSLWGNAVGATLVGSLGGILVAMVGTGQLNNYLQPSFRRWALLAGSFMVVLAVWTLVSMRRHTDVMTRENPMRRSSWLLVPPLTIAVVCAPPALGASMINSTSIGNVEDLSTSNGASSTTSATIASGQSGDLEQSSTVGSSNPADPNAAPAVAVSAEHTQNPGICRTGLSDGEVREYSDLSDAQVNEVNMDDLADRYSCGNKELLEGKEIRVQGFLSQGTDGRWQINRYKIYCCAAHALPYSAILIGDLVDPVEDQWVEVTGTVDTDNTDSIPDLYVDQVSAIPQPGEPYL